MTDAVVVGGGAVGCAAALHLARAGARVVLLEARRPGWSASGRNAGAIRAHGRHPAELPLALEARRLWTEIARESPVDPLLRADGDLVVALTPEEQAHLARTSEGYRRLGLEVEMLDGDGARRIVPALAEDVRGAAWCPSDLTAYPIAASRALATMAIEAGVEVRSFAEVVAIGEDRSVTTGDGSRVTARALVLAAGARTAEVGALAGLRLPVVPRRSQMLVTERTGSVLRPFVSGNGLYCRQSPYGNLLVGGGGRWERVGHDLGTTVPTLHRLSSRFLRLFPSLDGLRVVRTWSGTVALTPDHRPLVGEAAPGVFVAAAFNGHGFGIAPAVGRAVADLVTNGHSDLDLSPFRPDRFAAGLDWPAEYARRVAGAREPVGP